MSFPPPPPPPGPPPPVAGMGNDRGQLLQSIRQGALLKKTTTNDRSTPLIAGKVGNSGSSNTVPANSNTALASNYRSNAGVGSNGMNTLFAGGIPKLKPTGRGIGTTTTTDTTTTTTNNNNNIVSTLLKQQWDSNPSSPRVVSHRRQFATDMKNRGPPPQPPPATYKPFMPTSTSDSVLTSSRGVPTLPSKPPVGGYGKPNLAPKPPITLHKPSPPVKKLMINGGVPRPTVTRAQSMRVPRSPPVAHPADPPDLGTYGALPSFHQSQDSLHRMNPPPPPRTATLPSNLHQHGAKPAAPAPPRPTGVRPPITRPPPPPSRLGLPPPPPPTSAPPPPPHRTRLAPAVPSSAPPPPPVRNTSMRNGVSPGSTDMEVRFAAMFHLVQEFPPPQTFLRITKVYNSKNVLKQPAPLIAKQQAPKPPQPPVLQLKMWNNDSSSC